MAETVVQIEEARWMRSAQQGSADAFNRLIERHQTYLFNVAYRVLGNSEDAADATQEAFLSAFRAVRDFRGGSLRGWLTRIVVNACYDSRRSTRRRPAASMDAIVEEVGEAPWPDPHADDPEQLALSRDSLAQIEAALGELPMEQRIVVVLVDVQGLSYEEAANAMDCAVGTIRSRLSRARAELRDVLRAGGNFS